ncbi:hypothetical protein BGZ57DRAFT_917281 [Hyaloscypha finlandica]|nr:hypothetical protein BGZ57DRAFT_917281 [Hyaloscypha finlandica]
MPPLISTSISFGVCLCTGLADTLVLFPPLQDLVPRSHKKNSSLPSLLPSSLRVELFVELRERVREIFYDLLRRAQLVGYVQA